VTADDIPADFWRFLREDCGFADGAWTERSPVQLPPTARRLLDHPNDMTSTLAEYYGGPLGVEVLQDLRREDFYLREVFLRSSATGGIVEYGVIAIAFEQFEASEQASILEGRTPMGALLHRFRIPFVSAPIGFFSLVGEALARSRLAAMGAPVCHGRFNRLGKPGGEPLAWIMEILPGDGSDPATRPPASFRSG
jgi:hypothetical protein